MNTMYRLPSDIQKESKGEHLEAIATAFLIAILREQMRMK
nr:hypothetical protein [uncultured Mediterranean phage uvMED]